MKDISNRKDLEYLMQQFYNELLRDQSISYIFTDVAHIDLEKHLPHIIDFWEQSLFNSVVYKNNVLQIHRDLNAKENLMPHFETWLSHLNAVVDRTFEGVNAEKLKSRSLSIATVMRIKLI